ncbi:MAG: right-handed parallel beta-helix repeat-containing protein [Polyangia bacterium]|jgi:hypothetical protein|nr:right-handed parallel beta-helix repeat-containing protein [Polyangia bacterium]
MRIKNRRTDISLTRLSCLAAVAVIASGFAACGDDDGGTNIPDGAADGAADASDAGAGDAEPIMDGSSADASTVITPDGGDECTGVTCDPECAVFVDRSVSTPGNGATAQTALATVQAGLETAAQLAGPCCACEVRVAEGRYHIFKNSPFDTLQLRSRVSLYGGYPQGFDEARDPARYRTILDGQQTDDGPNHVYHVVTGANGAVLDGFVITGGRARADANPFNPDNYGGGLLVLNTSPRIASCAFEANEAIYGGGAYVTHSTAIFSGCRFTENLADEAGGGLYAHAGAPIISRCDFRRNHATHGGGLRLGPGADAQVYNTTFWRNTATGLGGGLQVELAEPTLTSNSFHANSASAGGALHASGSAHPVVTNCVLWGDLPNEIQRDSSSTVTATYCDVQGGCTVAGECTTDQTGNIDANPHFLDGDMGDLRLWVTSPVVDQGDNAAASMLPSDQEGDPRVLDGDDDNQAVVDMGADELAWTLDNIPIIYVDKSAAGANDGSSWADAYVELRTALSEASAFHQIWVATGTYTPSNLGDRDSSFQIPAGVLLFGGFAPTQGIIHMALRDPETYETVLSGDIMEDDHLGTFHNNSRHVVRSGHCVLLDGFTVTGGHTSIMGAYGGDGLGGCLQVGAGHLFAARRCRFTDCSANVGGAIWADDGSVLILDSCTMVDNNVMNGSGGAVALDHPAAGTLLENCILDSNMGDYGGALHIYGGEGVTLDTCTFSSNSASMALYGGGSIRADSVTDLLITGCTLTGNTAPVGGGVTLYHCTGSLLENTSFDGNHASDSWSIDYCDSSYELVRGAGGGLFLDGGDARISECAFAGNHAVHSGGCNCNHPDYKYFLGVGGGFFARDAALDIVGSTFSNNQAEHPGTGCLAGSGGGGAAYETTVRMVNTHFWSNAASVDLNALNICMAGGGGGFWSYWNTEVKLANCAFAGNSASDGGAGLFFSNSTAHLYGVAATANSGSYYGSGAYLDSGSLYVYNSIFWGNAGTSPSYSQVSLGYGGGCASYRKLFTYFTDIYNTPTGDGCLPDCTGSYGACVKPRHFDPGFVNPLADPPDLRLQSGGAAVNAGSNDPAHQAADWLDIDNDGDTTEAVPFDPDGHPRRTGIIDLGAYERP